MTDISPHHVERINQAHDRIGAVEKRVTVLETSEAVAAERNKHIQKSLDLIETNISRVVWLIITAIIGAVLAFIINGGLNVG